MAFLSLFMAIALFFVAIKIDMKHNKVGGYALIAPTMIFAIALSRSLSRWFYIGRERVAIDDFASAIEKGNAVDQIFFILTLFLGLSILLKRRDIVGKIISENKPWVLLFLYCFFSIFWSDHLFVSLKRYIKDFNAVIMVLVIASEQQPIEAFKAIMKRIMFLFVPLSIVFCKYFPNIGRYQTASWDYIYTGVTTHKNPLGKLCMLSVMIFVIEIVPLIKNRDYKFQPGLFRIYALYILLSIYLMTFAHSMTSNICLILGLVLYFSKFLKKHLTKAFVTFSILYITGLIELLISSLEGIFFNLVNRDLTLTGRTDLWEAVLKVKNNALIGVGYSAFWLGDRLESLIETFIFLPKQAHNGYIEVYINLGLIGLSLLIIAIIMSYKKISRPLHNNDFYAFQLSYFVIFLVSNFTEATFLFNIPSMWLVFLFVVFLCNRETFVNQNLAVHR